MLDRYLLRYFLAVVDHGNFSRAASYCNVAQPTLSVGIAKLEREVGAALFVRSKQRVELTASGTRLLAHARRIEREFNLALQSMGRSVSLPSLRLGILSSIPGTMIAGAIADTRPEREHRLELVFASERELNGHLAKNRIDVALTIVSRDANRYMEVPVCSEGYALAMSAEHSLAGRSEISAEQLANDSMIVRRHCEALPEVSRFFLESGVRPHLALRSRSDDRVMQMVAAGLGITVMPECYRFPGMVRPKLAGFGMRRTLGWAAIQKAEPLLHNPPALMARAATLCAEHIGSCGS